MHSQNQPAITEPFVRYTQREREREREKGEI